MKRDGGKREENMGLEVDLSESSEVARARLSAEVWVVFLGNPPNLTENKQSDRAL